MQIHRAFWIKLGRLAALLDTIDESRAALQKIERGPSWMRLDEVDRDALMTVRKNLDDIANLD